LPNPYIKIKISPLALLGGEKIVKDNLKVCSMNKNVPKIERFLFSEEENCRIDSLLTKMRL